MGTVFRIRHLNCFPLAIVSAVLDSRRRFVGDATRSSTPNDRSGEWELGVPRRVTTDTGLGYVRRTRTRTPRYGVVVMSGAKSSVYGTKSYDEGIDAGRQSW